MKFATVPLSSLFPSKSNPRQKFDTQEDIELQESIKTKGIIEPLITRYTDDPNKYEVVCGGRRYHAALKISKSNGNMKVPVIIRKLTDDEAFDLMTIENLQRKDLTKLEEAQGFKEYMDRNKDSIKELSERLNLTEGYIRKRVTIMQLPKKVLTAWDKGILSFGHLEQFIRLQNLDTQNELIEYVLKHQSPVNRLKYSIDSLSPNLDSAIFDRKAAKCASCHHNTAKQKNLFDIEQEKQQCLNPACFEDNTRKFLTKNFKNTDEYKKHKTNGFRLYKDVTDFKTMWPNEVDDECKKCKDFISVFDTVGHRSQAIACIKPKCYNAKRKAETSSVKKAKPAGAPRVDWHGEHFREKFYKERIPQIIEKNLKPDSEVTLRLAAFSILHGHKFLHTWFARKFNIEKKRIDKMEPGDEYYFSLDGKKIFEPLLKLKSKDLKQLIKEALSIIIVNKDFYPENRQLVANHLNIDLKKEWTPDQEYFDKKHKPEILEMGHKFKIFDQKPVKDYLSEVLGKQPSQIENLKKSELVELFLKSGANLSGVVPEEIWKT